MYMIGTISFLLLLAAVSIIVTLVAIAVCEEGLNLLDAAAVDAAAVTAKEVVSVVGCSYCCMKRCTCSWGCGVSFSTRVV